MTEPDTIVEARRALGFGVPHRNVMLALLKTAADLFAENQALRRRIDAANNALYGPVDVRRARIALAEDVALPEVETSDQR